MLGPKYLYVPSRIQMPLEFEGAIFVFCRQLITLKGKFFERWHLLKQTLLYQGQKYFVLLLGFNLLSFLVSSEILQQQFVLAVQVFGLKCAKCRTNGMFVSKNKQRWHFLLLRYHIICEVNTTLQITLVSVRTRVEQLQWVQHCLLAFGLFNDAFSSHDCAALNDYMIG